MVSNMKKHKNSNIIEHIIYPNGHEEWYQNDKLHRDNDQPACINTDGRMEWYKNGKLHRDDDNKPIIVREDGSMIWYIEN